MITDKQFSIWFDGEEWVVTDEQGDLIGMGCTPTSAMIDAEGRTLRQSRPVLALVPAPEAGPFPGMHVGCNYLAFDFCNKCGQAVPPDPCAATRP